MSEQSEQQAQPRARAQYALRHLVLHDSDGSYAEAVMDWECVDITWVMRGLPVERDEQGQPVYEDARHHVRLSASDMDRLARAWLRYRASVDEQDQGQ